MGGGLMQLVAYGAQDVYLTGNPQITFFKVVYRRHTNFAMETIEHTLSGTPDFGRRASVTIIRNGDLASRLYLKVRVSDVDQPGFTGEFAWVRRLGHALLKSAEIDIGGSRIDRHYGVWLDVWYELTHSTDQERGYSAMIGDVPELTRLEGIRAGTAGRIKDEYTIYIPLPFWFCRNTGLALPLIALQYHEVRLHLEFEEAAKLGVWSGNFNVNNLAIKDASLLVDYIYLDSEERRRFAQVGHEYLIEQLQFTGEESIQTSATDSTTGKYKLGFNHPCKELIWAVKGGNFTSGASYLAYTHSDDWSVALENAAQNIANGMFTTTTTLAAATNLYKVSAGATPDNVESILLGSALTSSTAGSGDVTHRVVVDVTGTFSDDFLGGSIIDHFVDVVQNAFWVGGYNLADKIDRVLISVSGTIAAPVLTVKVLSHSLTIRDISIPVSSWTDNRVYSAAVNGNVNRDVTVYQPNNYGVLLDGSGNPVAEALLQLNGHDRFDKREGNYFNYVQVWQHHTHTPADGINVYSFGVHPEQHQPSGTANLSRIDNTQLNLTFQDPTANRFNTATPPNAPTLDFFGTDTLLYIFAHNYNVLRIMSGMGGLAYSN
jgi:hypothetical protein